MIRPIQTAVAVAAILAATNASADIRIVVNTHGSGKPIGGKLLLHAGSAPQSAQIPFNLTGPERQVRLSSGTW